MGGNLQERVAYGQSFSAGSLWVDIPHTATNDTFPLLDERHRNVTVQPPYLIVIPAKAGIQ